MAKHKTSPKSNNVMRYGKKEYRIRVSIWKVFPDLVTVKDEVFMLGKALKSPARPQSKQIQS